MNFLKRYALLGGAAVTGRGAREEGALAGVVVAHRLLLVLGGGGVLGTRPRPGWHSGGRPDQFDPAAARCSGT